MKKFKLVINGEGSGDIHSLIAVVSQIQVTCAKEGRQAKFLYLGSSSEHAHMLKANGIKSHKVAYGNIWAKTWGFAQAMWWNYWFMPDAVFSNGGETASIVKAAGKFYFVPFIFHEQNAVPELKDQKLAHGAKKIALSFAPAAKYFEGELVHVGAPVRNDILLKEGESDQVFAKTSLGFDAGKPLLFVNGGSAGASTINDFIVRNLPDILPVIQVMHQTGRAYYEEVVAGISEISSAVPDELMERYRAVDYLEKEMKEAYIAADLILARSGPGTLAEIAAFKKPSILVPAPETENPTQRYNASEFAARGAAVVIEEENLLPSLVTSKLRDLLANPEKLSTMSEAARKEHKPNAAKDLAKIILGGV